VGQDLSEVLRVTRGHAHDRALDRHELSARELRAATAGAADG
jgi:hypothetical protein